MVGDIFLFPVLFEISLFQYHFRQKHAHNQTQQCVNYPQNRNTELQLCCIIYLSIDGSIEKCQTGEWKKVDKDEIKPVDIDGDVNRVLSEFSHCDFIQSCVVFGFICQFHMFHFPEAWQIVYG